jgi:predicted component of type VI protein secretion system
MLRTIQPAPPFDGSGLEHCAERGGFVLGSDPYLVDAVVDHPSVSRRHARLTRHRARICIEDLHSVNGTRVNGRRVERFAPTELAPGDEVALGAVDVAVVLWGRLGTGGPDTPNAFPTPGKDMP